MNIIYDLITEDKYLIKCPYKMTPEYITVHNTANDASARNEIAYMKRNNNEISYHVAIDDIEVIIGIPFDRSTYNAGDGNGKGNRASISIEICYSKSGGERFNVAERNTAKYIAMLLEKYNWGIDRVKKHQDWSNKYCPHRTLDMGWQRFINMIIDEMNGEDVEMLERIEKLEQRVTALENNKPVPAPERNLSVGDRVTLSSSATVYQGASKGVNIPNSVKGRQYTIQQISGDSVLLKEIVSWVLKAEVF